MDWTRDEEWLWLDALRELCIQARDAEDYEAMVFYREWWNAVYLKRPERSYAK